MKVLVVGASAGTGWQVVQQLLTQGHEVTAFARRAEQLPDLGPALHRVPGDATCPEDLDRAMPGHEAVVITLGISESALRVRLLGPARSAPDVRSAGTQQVLDAMKRHGLRRVLVQTSFGVGPTRPLLPLAVRLVFALLLKPQIEDTERQEALVRASGLDWVILQPVNLTDDPQRDGARMSPTGEIGQLKVSRQQVADCIARVLASPALRGQTLALSAA